MDTLNTGVGELVAESRDEVDLPDRKGSELLSTTLVNAPESPETRLVSPGLCETVSCSVVNLLDLDRRQIIDPLVGPLVVEPIDVVQGLAFDVAVRQGPSGQISSVL